MTTSQLLSLTTMPATVPVPRPAPSQAEAPSQPASGDQVVLAAPGKAQEGPQPTQMERLLDSNTVAQIVGGGKLKSGDTVTISTNGEPVLTIKKDGVTALDKFKTFASDVFHTTAVEVSNIVAQDPAFAFKESALLVKDQVYRGVPTDLQGFADKAFLPMVRVVAIALDTKKAIDTFKRNESTKIDKFVDGAHLATDLAGLGGAISYAIPAVGTSVATALTVAGLVGDIAAYGYHVMKYFMERGMQVGDPNNPPPAKVGTQKP